MKKSHLVWWTQRCAIGAFALVVGLTSSTAVGAMTVVAPKDSPESVIGRADMPNGGGVAGDVPGTCGAATLTQNTSFVPGPGVGCFVVGEGTRENGWARAFPLPPSAPTIVNCVDFGVDANVGGDFTVTVNILTGDPNAGYASLILHGSMAVTIPDGTSNAIVKADFAASGQPVVVPPGTTLIVEVVAPSRVPSDGGDGGAFFLAANGDGQSAPSYLRAAACGLPDFIDLAVIGFPHAHVLIRADVGPLHWSVIEVENNSGQPAADLHLTFAGTGGSVIVLPGLVVAPGCPTPAVPSNGQVTNTVVIDWGVACVPPGARVLFVLATPFGPPTYAGGFWTDVNGQNIGDIAPSRVTVDTVFVGGGFIPPTKPFVVIKRQVRYRLINPVYSPWAKPPGECWQRWCCVPPGGRVCLDRLTLCRFPDRISRFLELIGPGFGNCILLRDWREFDTNAEVEWLLQTQTQDPGTGVLPGGPKPEKPLLFAFGEPAYDGDRMQLFQSDDGGESSYPSSDLASAFFDLSGALKVTTNNPALPPIVGFPNLTQAMAPGYYAAAGSLAPLEIELVQLSLQGLHPLVDVVRDQIAGLRVDLMQIAEGLSAGVPPDAKPYFDAAQRFQQLGTALVPLSGGSPQYLNAAEYLERLAEAMNQSGNMVLTGLPTPLQQDAYLWAQLERFKLISASFAASTLPHVRLQYDLGLMTWGPETGQIHLDVRPAVAGPLQPPLIEGLAPINEFGHVILNGLELGTVPSVRVWSKAPTHLAVTHDVPNLTGHVAPEIQLLNGDADGNNCVNFDDIDYVLATQGQGGTFAPIVPSSDVNRDGVVSFPDLQIVQAGLGNCGAEPPGACIGDLNGDDIVSGADIAIVLGNWNTGGPTGDANGDGLVNGLDIGIVLGNWGPCP